MGDAPRQVEITPDTLKVFARPLWERLECESVTPLSAIEGVEDGYRYTLLDLEHRGFGLRGDNGRRVVTTFVIVAIPEAMRGRGVGWQPPGWQVSVDADFAYLARPQTRARPGEWREQIRMAIKVVESLTTRGADAGQPPARTYRPMGDGVASNAISAALFLVFGTLLVGYGLAIMVGLIDYRTGCLPHDTAGRCLDTPHAYSVVEALVAGGKRLLAGAFLVWGAHHFREKIRQRRRLQAEVEPDR